MALFNHKKQFASKILAGKKKIVIVARKRDGKGPKTGEIHHHKNGCYSICNTECTEVLPISIEDGHRVTVGITELNNRQLIKLSESDGFDIFTDFIDFYSEKYGLPFYGIMIKWEKISTENIRTLNDDINDIPCICLDCFNLEKKKRKAKNDNRFYCYLGETLTREKECCGGMATVMNNIYSNKKVESERDII